VKYLTENCQLPDVQSEYRADQSTETAIVKATSFWHWTAAMLSATANHITLMQQLQTSYGFDRVVTQCFTLHVHS